MFAVTDSFWNCYFIAPSVFTFIEDQQETLRSFREKFKDLFEEFLIADTD